MSEENTIKELIERDAALLAWTQDLVEYYNQEISKFEINPHQSEMVKEALIHYITLLRDGAMKQCESGQKVINEAKEKVRVIN